MVGPLIFETQMSVAPAILKARLTVTSYTCISEVGSSWRRRICHEYEMAIPTVLTCGAWRMERRKRGGHGSKAPLDVSVETDRTKATLFFFLQFSSTSVSMFGVPP